MKKLFLMCFVVMLSLFFCSTTFAETATEDVIAALDIALSDAFDYYETRYSCDNSTLIVNVAIDGFANDMYAAKENGIDSSDETWNQIKGMFLTIYYGCESLFETCGIAKPDSIILQLWNDDVAIRNDYSTGKSSVLLAVTNGLFFIDEMEAY